MLLHAETLPSECNCTPAHCFEGTSLILKCAFYQSSHMITTLDVKKYHINNKITFLIACFQQGKYKVLWVKARYIEYTFFLSTSHSKKSVLLKKKKVLREKKLYSSPTIHNPCVRLCQNVKFSGGVELPSESRLIICREKKNLNPAPGKVQK